MGDSDLSNAAEDFLKVALELERSEGRATTNELARRLRVSAPTATAMAKRLDAQGLVTRTPYRGVTLTDRGRLVALEGLLTTVCSSAISSSRWACPSKRCTSRPIASST